MNLAGRYFVMATGSQQPCDPVPPAFEPIDADTANPTESKK